MPTLRKKYQKKVKLAVHGRQVKWAPFWAVVRKYGLGKKVHPSRMTRLRRSWRHTRLKIKPRKTRKQHLG